MGKYEVTQEQYEQVMGVNPAHLKGAKNPVERVTWNSAVEFCRRLSAKTGRTMRLPTEAEWEYAARAGSTGARYGDLDSVAWYKGNSGKSTHTVGKKKPNAWGLYDMLGNVWEWCHDWKGDYPSGAVKDPTGPQAGLYRVSRGGSWCRYARDVRAASRRGDAPDRLGGGRAGRV